MTSAASRPPVSDSAVASVAPRRAAASTTSAAAARCGRDRCRGARGYCSSMALPIEDYALIGDRHTAALVGKNGSIDWLCLPRFDSPACFAGLLGDDSHGHWQLEPTTEYDVTRRYVDDSAALETTFTTEDGEVTLLDLMPTGDDRADVVRRLTGVRGSVRMRHEWVVRMDYGAIRPWVRRRDIRGEEVITAVAGPDKLVLRGPRLPVADENRHLDEFVVEAGDVLTFSMTWIPSYERTPPSADPPIEQTIADESAWAARCHDDVPHADVVRRSLLTLRLMTHEQTGGIVAAPDHLAARGLRRRAQLGLPLLLAARRRPDHRVAHRRRLHRRGGVLAALAAARGRRRPRRPADHVRRRRLATPARAHAGPPARLRGLPSGADRQRRGRAAPDRRPGRGDGRAVGRPGRRARQRRGLVAPAAQPGQPAGATPGRSPTTASGRSAARSGASRTPASWCGRPSTARIRAVEDEGMEGPVDRWREARDEVCEAVLTRGFDADRNTFTQHDETTEVDASLLVLPARRLHQGRRPEDARHDRGHREGPDARRPADALPHRDRRRRPGRRRAPLPGLLVLAGLGVRRRRPPRRRRTPSSTGSSASSTTSACCRRSTTRATTAWSATSRRPSAT